MEKLNELQIQELIKTAIDMRAFSYVPYSNYRVGAALLTTEGKIYTGCNIENAGYTPCNCAERTAFFKAVSEGVRDFRAICVVGGKDGPLTEYAAPCGVCRQVMMEFCNFVDIKTREKKIEICKLLKKSDEKMTIKRISEITGIPSSSVDRYLKE